MSLDPIVEPVIIGVRVVRIGPRLVHLRSVFEAVRV